ncbi:MAG TPA: hypothetical protein VK066_27825 [Chloroflexota bacterium]|nr:hypothetical protein [Chloroflexota bacterium]
MRLPGASRPAAGPAPVGAGPAAAPTSVLPEDRAATAASRASRPLAAHDRAQRARPASGGGGSRGCPAFTLWLNAARQDCALPAAGAPLLDALAAHGLACRLATRAWRDPALAGEPLLVAVGPLDGPLEIVHNGALAAVGVAHLWVRPGDEVVIGQPAYLRQRFAFFR